MWRCTSDIAKIRVGDGVAVLVSHETGGKFGAEALPENAGVDVAIEQAVEITRPGGRVVPVGIPAEDRHAFKHSAARRKGLTIVFSRRMKHMYPRAIQLVGNGQVDLRTFASHQLPLRRTAKAVRLVRNLQG
ncbi:MAG: zinc-binding dehydrogenase [Verrucomicrobiota bacterium]